MVRSRTVRAYAPAAVIAGGDPQWKVVSRPAARKTVHVSGIAGWYYVVLATLLRGIRKESHYKVVKGLDSDGEFTINTAAAAEQRGYYDTLRKEEKTERRRAAAQRDWFNVPNAVESFFDSKLYHKLMRAAGLADMVGAWKVFRNTPEVAQLVKSKKAAMSTAAAAEKADRLAYKKRVLACLGKDGKKKAKNFILGDDKTKETSEWFSSLCSTTRIVLTAYWPAKVVKARAHKRAATAAAAAKVAAFEKKWGTGEEGRAKQAIAKARYEYFQTAEGLEELFVRDQRRQAAEERKEKFVAKYGEGEEGKAKHAEAKAAWETRTQRKEAISASIKDGTARVVVRPDGRKKIVLPPAFGAAALAKPVPAKGTAAARLAVPAGACAPLPPKPITTTTPETAGFWEDFKPLPTAAPAEVALSEQQKELLPLGKGLFEGKITTDEVVEEAISAGLCERGEASNKLEENLVVIRNHYARSVVKPQPILSWAEKRAKVLKDQEERNAVAIAEAEARKVVRSDDSTPEGFEAKEGERHEHVCVACNTTYVHYHQHEGKHAQRDKQCPNKRCISFHGGKNLTNSQTLKSDEKFEQTKREIIASWKLRPFKECVKIVADLPSEDEVPLALNILSDLVYSQLVKFDKFSLNVSLEGIASNNLFTKRFDNWLNKKVYWLGLNSGLMPDSGKLWDCYSKEGCRKVMKCNFCHLPYACYLSEEGDCPYKTCKRHTEGSEVIALKKIVEKRCRCGKKIDSALTTCLGCWKTSAPTSHSRGVPAFFKQQSAIAIRAHNTPNKGWEDTYGEVSWTTNGKANFLGLTRAIHTCRGEIDSSWMKVGHDLATKVNLPKIDLNHHVYVPLSGGTCGRFAISSSISSGGRKYPAFFCESELVSGTPIIQNGQVVSVVTTSDARGLYTIMCEISERDLPQGIPEKIWFSPELAEPVVYKATRDLWMNEEEEVYHPRPISECTANIRVSTTMRRLAVKQHNSQEPFDGRAHRISWYAGQNSNIMDDFRCIHTEEGAIASRRWHRSGCDILSREEMPHLDLEDFIEVAVAPNQLMRFNITGTVVVPNVEHGVLYLNEYHSFTHVGDDLVSGTPIFQDGRVVSLVTNSVSGLEYAIMTNSPINSKQFGVGKLDLYDGFIVYELPLERVLSVQELSVFHRVTDEVPYESFICDTLHGMMLTRFGRSGLAIAQDQLVPSDQWADQKHSTKKKKNVLRTVFVSALLAFSGNAVLASPAAQPSRAPVMAPRAPRQTGGPGAGPVYNAVMNQAPAPAPSVVTTNGAIDYDQYTADNRVEWKGDNVAIQTSIAEIKHLMNEYKKADIEFAKTYVEILSGKQASTPVRFQYHCNSRINDKIQSFMDEEELKELNQDIGQDKIGSLLVSLKTDEAMLKGLELDCEFLREMQTIWGYGFWEECKKRMVTIANKKTKLEEMVKLAVEKQEVANKLIPILKNEIENLKIEISVLTRFIKEGEEKNIPLFILMGLNKGAIPTANYNHYLDGGSGIQEALETAQRNINSVRAINGALKKFMSAGRVEIDERAKSLWSILTAEPGTIQVYDGETAFMVTKTKPDGTEEICYKTRSEEACFREHGAIYDDDQTVTGKLEQAIARFAPIAVVRQEPKPAEPSNRNKRATEQEVSKPYVPEFRVNWVKVATEIINILVSAGVYEFAGAGAGVSFLALATAVIIEACDPDLLVVQASKGKDSLFHAWGSLSVGQCVQFGERIVEIKNIRVWEKVAFEFTATKGIKTRVITEYGCPFGTAETVCEKDLACPLQNERGKKYCTNHFNGAFYKTDCAFPGDLYYNVLLCSKPEGTRLSVNRLTGQPMIKVEYDLVEGASRSTHTFIQGETISTGNDFSILNAERSKSFEFDYFFKDMESEHMYWAKKGVSIAEFCRVDAIGGNAVILNPECIRARVIQLGPNIEAQLKNTRFEEGLANGMIQAFGKHQFYLSQENQLGYDLSWFSGHFVMVDKPLVDHTPLCDNKVAPKVKVSKKGGKYKVNLVEIDLEETNCKITVQFEKCVVIGSQHFKVEQHKAVFNVICKYWHKDNLIVRGQQEQKVPVDGMDVEYKHFFHQLEDTIIRVSYNSSVLNAVTAFYRAIPESVKNYMEGIWKFAYLAGVVVCGAIGTIVGLQLMVRNQGIGSMFLIVVATMVGFLVLKADACNVERVGEPLPCSLIDACQFFANHVANSTGTDCVAFADDYCQHGAHFGYNVVQYSEACQATSSAHLGAKPALAIMALGFIGSKIGGIIRIASYSASFFIAMQNIFEIVCIMRAWRRAAISLFNYFRSDYATVCIIGDLLISISLWMMLSPVMGWMAFALVYMAKRPLIFEIMRKSAFEGRRVAQADGHWWVSALLAEAWPKKTNARIEEMRPIVRTNDVTASDETAFHCDLYNVEEHANEKVDMGMMMEGYRKAIVRMAPDEISLNNQFRAFGKSVCYFHIIDHVMVAPSHALKSTKGWSVYDDVAVYPKGRKDILERFATSAGDDCNIVIELNSKTDKTPKIRVVDGQCIRIDRNWRKGDSGMVFFTQEGKMWMHRGVRKGCNDISVNCLVKTCPKELLICHSGNEGDSSSPKEEGPLKSIALLKGKAVGKKWVAKGTQKPESNDGLTLLKGSTPELEKYRGNVNAVIAEERYDRLVTRVDKQGRTIHIHHGVATGKLDPEIYKKVEAPVVLKKPLFTRGNLRALEYARHQEEKHAKQHLVEWRLERAIRQACPEFEFIFWDSKMSQEQYDSISNKGERVLPATFENFFMKSMQRLTNTQQEVVAEAITKFIFNREDTRGFGRVSANDYAKMAAVNNVLSTNKVTKLSLSGESTIKAIEVSTEFGKVNILKKAGTPAPSRPSSVSGSTGGSRSGSPLKEKPEALAAKGKVTTKEVEKAAMGIQGQFEVFDEMDVRVCLAFRVGTKIAVPAHGCIVNTNGWYAKNDLLVNDKSLFTDFISVSEFEGMKEEDFFMETKDHNDLGLRLGPGGLITKGVTIKGTSGSVLEIESDEGPVYLMYVGDRETVGLNALDKEFEFYLVARDIILKQIVEGDEIEIEGLHCPHPKDIDEFGLDLGFGEEEHKRWFVSERRKALYAEEGEDLEAYEIREETGDDEEERPQSPESAEEINEDNGIIPHGTRFDFNLFKEEALKEARITADSVAADLSLQFEDNLEEVHVKQLTHYYQEHCIKVLQKAHPNKEIIDKLTVIGLLLPEEFVNWTKFASYLRGKGKLEFLKELNAPKVFCKQHDNCGRFVKNIRGNNGKGCLEKIIHGLPVPQYVREEENEAKQILLWLLDPEFEQSPWDADQLDSRLRNILENFSTPEFIRLFTWVDLPQEVVETSAPINVSGSLLMTPDTIKYVDRIRQEIKTTSRVVFDIKYYTVKKRASTKEIIDRDASWINNAGVLYAMRFAAGTTGWAFIDRKIGYSSYHVTRGRKIELTVTTNPMGTQLVRDYVEGVPTSTITLENTERQETFRGDLCVYGMPGQNVEMKKPAVGQVYNLVNFEKRTRATLLCTGAALTTMEEKTGESKMVDHFAFIDVSRDGQVVPVPFVDRTKGYSGLPILDEFGHPVGIFGFLRTMRAKTENGVIDRPESARPSVQVGQFDITTKAVDVLQAVRGAGANGKWLRLGAPTASGKSTRLVKEIGRIMYQKARRPIHIAVLEPRVFVVNNLWQGQSMMTNADAKDCTFFNIVRKHGRLYENDKTQSHKDPSQAKVTITYMTYGSMVASLGKELRWDLVILDEFHSRSDSDVLAVDAALQVLGHYNGVMAMTATFWAPDPTMNRFVDYSIGTAKKFPIERKVIKKFDSVTEGEEGLYFKIRGPDGTFYALPRESCNAGGKTIVFLDSKNNCAKGMKELLATGPGVNVMTLTSENRDVEIPDGQVVIFATNVAESGVTIVNCDNVISFGVQIEPQAGFDVNLGEDGTFDSYHSLVQTKITTCAETQQMGRTGRTCPGTFWTTMTTPLPEMTDFPRHAMSGAYLTLMRNDEVMEMAEVRQRGGQWEDLLHTLRNLHPKFLPASLNFRAVKGEYPSIIELKDFRELHIREGAQEDIFWRKLEVVQCIQYIDPITFYLLPNFPRSWVENGRVERLCGGDPNNLEKTRKAKELVQSITIDDVTWKNYLKAMSCSISNNIMERMVSPQWNDSDDEVRKAYRDETFIGIKQHSGIPEVYWGGAGAAVAVAAAGLIFGQFYTVMYGKKVPVEIYMIQKQNIDEIMRCYEYLTLEKLTETNKTSVSYWAEHCYNIVTGGLNVVVQTLEDSNPFKRWYNDNFVKAKTHSGQNDVWEMVLEKIQQAWQFFQDNLPAGRDALITSWFGAGAITGMGSFYDYFCSELTPFGAFVVMTGLGAIAMAICSIPQFIGACVIGGMGYLVTHWLGGPSKNTNKFLALELEKQRKNRLFQMESGAVIGGLVTKFLLPLMNGGNAQTAQQFVSNLGASLASNYGGAAVGVAVTATASKSAVDRIGGLFEQSNTSKTYDMYIQMRLLWAGKVEIYSVEGVASLLSMFQGISCLWTFDISSLLTLGIAAGVDWIVESGITSITEASYQRYGLLKPGDAVGKNFLDSSEAEKLRRIEHLKTVQTAIHCAIGSGLNPFCIIPSLIIVAAKKLYEGTEKVTVDELITVYQKSVTTNPAVLLLQMVYTVWQRLKSVGDANLHSDESKISWMMKLKDTISECVSELFSKIIEGAKGSSKALHVIGRILRQFFKIVIALTGWIMRGISNKVQEVVKSLVDMAVNSVVEQCVPTFWLRWVSRTKPATNKEPEKLDVSVERFFRLYGMEQLLRVVPSIMGNKIGCGPHARCPWEIKGLFDLKMWKMLQRVEFNEDLGDMITLLRSLRVDKRNKSGWYTTLAPQSVLKYMISVVSFYASTHSQLLGEEPIQDQLIGDTVHFSQFWTESFSVSVLRAHNLRQAFILLAVGSKGIVLSWKWEEPTVLSGKLGSYMDDYVEHQKNLLEGIIDREGSTYVSLKVLSPKFGCLEEIEWDDMLHDIAFSQANIVNQKGLYYVATNVTPLDAELQKNKKYSRRFKCLINHFKLEQNFIFKAVEQSWGLRAGIEDEFETREEHVNAIRFDKDGVVVSVAQLSHWGSNYGLGVFTLRNMHLDFGRRDLTAWCHLVTGLPSICRISEQSSEFIVCDIFKRLGSKEQPMIEVLNWGFKIHFIKKTSWTKNMVPGRNLKLSSMATNSLRKTSGNRSWMRMLDATRSAANVIVDTSKFMVERSDYFTAISRILHTSNEKKFKKDEEILTSAQLMGRKCVLPHMIWEWLQENTGEKEWLSLNELYAPPYLNGPPTKMSQVSFELEQFPGIRMYMALGAFFTTEFYLRCDMENVRVYMSPGIVLSPTDVTNVITNGAFDGPMPTVCLNLERKSWVQLCSPYGEIVKALSLNFNPWVAISTDPSMDLQSDETRLEENPDWVFTAMNSPGRTDGLAQAEALRESLNGFLSDLDGVAEGLSCGIEVSVEELTKEIYTCVEREMNDAGKHTNVINEWQGQKTVRGGTVRKFGIKTSAHFGNRVSMEVIKDPYSMAKVKLHAPSKIDEESPRDNKFLADMARDQGCGKGKQEEMNECLGKTNLDVRTIKDSRLAVKVALADDTLTPIYLEESAKARTKSRAEFAIGNLKRAALGVNAVMNAARLGTQASEAVKEFVRQKSHGNNNVVNSDGDASSEASTTSNGSLASTKSFLNNFRFGGSKAKLHGSRDWAQCIIDALNPETYRSFEMKRPRHEVVNTRYIEALERYQKGKQAEGEAASSSTVIAEAAMQTKLIERIIENQRVPASEDVQRGFVESDFVVHFSSVSKRGLDNLPGVGSAFASVEMTMKMQESKALKIEELTMIRESEKLLQGLPVRPLFRETPLESQPEIPYQVLQSNLKSVQFIQGKLWEALATYNRVYKPYNIDIGTASRGFAKAQLMDRDLGLWSASQNYWDMTTGFGGFAQYFTHAPRLCKIQDGEIASRDGRKKTLVFNSLSLAGHAAPIVDHIINKEQMDSGLLLIKQLRTEHGHGHQGDLRDSRLLGLCLEVAEDAPPDFMMFDAGEQSENLEEEARWMIKNIGIEKELKDYAFCQDYATAVEKYLKIVKQGGTAVVRMVGFSDVTKDLIRRFSRGFRSLCCYKNPSTTLASREWYLVLLGRDHKLDAFVQYTQTDEKEYVFEEPSKFANLVTKGSLEPGKAKFFMARTTDPFFTWTNSSNLQRSDVTDAMRLSEKNFFVKSSQVVDFNYDRIVARLREDWLRAFMTFANYAKANHTALKRDLEQFGDEGHSLGAGQIIDQQGKSVEGKAWEERLAEMREQWPNLTLDNIVKKTKCTRRFVVPRYYVPFWTPRDGMKLVKPGTEGLLIDSLLVKKKLESVSDPRFTIYGETFDSRLTERIAMLRVTAKEAGKRIQNPSGLFTNVLEPFKINLGESVGKEKHIVNMVLSDMAYYVFGLTMNNSVIGHTQRTAEFLRAAWKKRLDIAQHEPSNEDANLLRTSMEAIMTPECKRIANGANEEKFEPWSFEQACEEVHKQGKGGHFDKYVDFGEAIKDPQFKEDVLRRVAAFSAGRTVPTYQVCRDKVETKAKKNIDNGRLLIPDCTDEIDPRGKSYKYLPYTKKEEARRARQDKLRQASNIAPRNIRFAEFVQRFADLMILGPVQKYHAHKEKLYYGSSTGTPLWRLGNLTKALHDVYAPRHQQEFWESSELGCDVCGYYNNSSCSCLIVDGKLCQVHGLKHGETQSSKCKECKTHRGDSANEQEWFKNIMNNKTELLSEQAYIRMYDPSFRKGLERKALKAMIASGDFSGFDGTVSKTDLVLNYIFYKNIYRSEYHLMLKTRWEHWIWALVINDHGHVIVSDGQRSSGDQDTSFGNTMINGIYHFASTALSLGISIEEAATPIGEVWFRSDFDYTTPKYKKLYLHRISHISDGDDNLHFGSKEDIEKFDKNGPMLLERAGKKIRCGTRSGYDLTESYSGISYCSHNYNRCRIGKISTPVEMAEMSGVAEMVPIDCVPKTFKKVDNDNLPLQHLRDKKLGLRVEYMPARAMSEIIGKLVMTMKGSTANMDFTRDYGSSTKEQKRGQKNEEAIAITRGKLLSYLLNYCQYSVVRILVMSAFSIIGDGVCNLQELKRRYNVPSIAKTIGSALRGVFNISTLQEMESLSPNLERKGLRMMRDNTYTEFGTTTLKGVGKTCPESLGELYERSRQWIERFSINYTEGMADWSFWAMANPNLTITNDQFDESGFILSKPSNIRQHRGGRDLYPQRSHQSRSNFLNNLWALLMVTSIVQNPGTSEGFTKRLAEDPELIDQYDLAFEMSAEGRGFPAMIENLYPGAKKVILRRIQNLGAAAVGRCIDVDTGRGVVYALITKTYMSDQATSESVRDSLNHMGSLADWRAEKDKKLYGRAAGQRRTKIVLLTRKFKVGNKSAKEALNACGSRTARNAEIALQ
nr:hypothetical polyprotein [Gentian Kobu-sho-associated virus]